MACVITVDGKSYDETGFKQMLGSGFLVNEINNGVLKDSKSEIYKQYINGNGTKEVTEGEGGQALQESVAPEGKGAETDQAAIESEAGNEIPGIELLTEDQKAEFDLAVKSINANRETPISAKEAFNKLVAYLGAEEVPLITNMKSALETVLDQSRAKNILKGLERSGKTKMSAKIAKSKLGRTLLGLAASMKSLGISMVVLSDEDFDNFIKDAYGISPDRNAIYVWGAKTMVLRASNTSQVAIHEFVHPILSTIQSIDEGMYESLMGDIDQLYHPSGMTFLKWAEKNYAGASLDTIKNEALTELISVVAQKRVDLKSSIAIAANKIWNSIMSFFGIKGAPINLKFDDTLTVDKLSKAISEAIVTFRSLEVENAVGIEQPTAEGIASSKDRDLVADAGLDKYMTEDGNGNYVFYHVSDLDLTKKGIDPNKLGSNARTGRDEVMAKHPVSMYYTEPDIDDVGGLYKHVMLIPKDKVYPIDSDPLNLKPQAEKEFRKVFPNISFDNNRASSWIAKVAAEKGYEMVVANWSPRRNFKALRAESVIKHKLKLYQSPRPGSFNAVVFNDKYEFESNRTSLKKRLEKSSSPDVITGGKMNKKAISSSKVTSTSAINVYEAKEVAVLPVVSLEELYDKYDGKAIVINSDPTRVGELKLPSGKNIFIYGGPGYLSIKNNVDGKVGFATTQISKVGTWQKYAQTLFGKGSSLTLVATQSPESILSNSYALRYVMDAISTLPKSVLKSSEFKTEFFGKDITLLADAFGEKAYKEFVSKYKKLDLSNPEVIDQMISDMAYKVGDNNSPASFSARRAFVSNLIAKVGVKKPVKFIAQELFKRHGLNTEKLLYEIGEKELVDLYLNGNKWGFLVSGFETDPKITIDSVQTSGIKHPLFNAKFPASNSFLLDGAYEVDKLFTPQVIETEKGGLYTKKAAQMLSGSMYVKGDRTENEGSFEYSKGTPIEGTKGISSNRDLRGTLDRLSGDLDATTRQAIEADPEAYIDPLKINEAKAKFGVLTDQDLMSYLSTSGIRILSLDPASNLGLMAKIEAIKRAQNSPDKKFEGTPLSALLVDAAKIGSVGGRILRMMRELGTINPTTYADLIIKMIESTGAVLSDENKDTIRLLSSDVISTSAKETSAHQQFKASPTRANQLSLIEAKKEAKLAIDELAKVIEAQMPVSVAKSFISNLQGNLLQIESLGVNLTSTTIGGGLLFLPKAIAKTGVSMFRVGIGKTFNTNGHNIAEIGYLSGLKYYIKAFAPAASKSLSILASGTDSEINAAKGEFRSSLKPLNLLNVLFNSEQYARRVKGSKEYDYRLSGGQYQVFDVKNPLVSVHTFNDEQAAKRMAFEMSNPLDWTNTGKYILKTVTGLAPEAMFRVMAATDTLIRDPNTAYINAMFGKRIGLSGQDLASFVFEPNPEYMKHLEYQAAKTVFQENRKGTQIITSALKDLEDISDSNILASALNVVVRTSMPYVKTPANIVSQYVNYALPFIPMYRAINAYSKAYSTNSESERNIHLNDAEESMSIALVGFGMWAAYTMLALGGLATAGYDHYDDDEKDIMLKNNIPYSSINVTAIKRMMDGGPIEAQPGDEFIAIKYFGLPGMVAQMHANRIQKAKSEAIKNGKVFNGDNDISMTSKFFEMFSVSDVMGTAFDQSFAAGINTIFGVMRDPESKTVYAARGYAQALVAGFGVPATLSKYMEAEYVPNLTDNSSAVKTARNVFMYRIAGITDGIPSKIDVFGRKLKTYTPEGKDPKIYNTFYPFKIKKSGTDKIDYMLYQTYLQSKDPAVIPSKYQQQDIMGASKALEVSGFRPTPADVEILNIDRGQRRLQHLIEVMESGYFPFIDQNGNVEEADSFDKLPIKDRVAYIKNAYKAADQEHITEFRDDYINKIAKGLGAKFKQEEE